MIAILFIGLCIWGMYDTKKKHEYKLEKLELEREKVALEREKLEHKIIEREEDKNELG